HKDFNISFEKFRIINLSFSINEKYRKKKVRISTELFASHKYSKAKKQLTIRLKATLLKGNMPFFFELVGEGLFVFDKTPEKETIEMVSSINGPAIMFPYMRETIADLTRRAGFKSLHLPPINFVKLAKALPVRKPRSLKKTPKQSK
ncbi:MAG: protein-export chaperone SecB, partial [Thermodesulfobacteriota bacterium]